MALTKITSSEISTGAITADKIAADVALGVRISNVSVANSTYHIIDDTAVNIGGGYIVITGAGFQSGVQVVIDETPATSTTFVSSTELRVQVPVKSSGTYDIYIVNPDGGNCIGVNKVTYSSTPTWVTGSTLTTVLSNIAFTGSLSATGATSYANTTALPAGFNLVTANGYYYGNISVGSSTTYNFTIRATDAENQESDREFSLPVDISIQATGGTITTSGGYKTHTFTANDNFVVTVGGQLEYLVVAGGGGGGYVDFGFGGGGGGAGGYRTGTMTITPGTYPVVIGTGGQPADNYGGFNGSNSSFNGITSTGGGGGVKWNRQGNSGGSGGGAGTAGTGGSGNAGSYSPVEGYAGIGGGPSGTEGGGGGGAGGAATNRLGGPGRTFYGVTYARGGDGGIGGIQGSAGGNNTGNGGGSSNYGGSGVVIIRYSI